MPWRRSQTTKRVLPKTTIGDVWGSLSSVDTHLEEIRMSVYARYDRAFINDAIELASRTERGLATVARNLGIPHSTLRNWYNGHGMAKKKNGRPAGVKRPPEDETPQEKIRRLEVELAAARREVESLKTDKEILKKAAAFFAKESE
jgi:transposase